MATVMALDVSMGKSYKVVYDDHLCLSAGEIVHSKTSFQELLDEIHTLPDDLMLIFESTGVYSKPLETFCKKKSEFVIVY